MATTSLSRNNITSLPHLLDIRSLPSVTLSDRRKLPDTKGVYFALDAEGKIQYIGKAAGKSGFSGRWTASHHRYACLSKMPGTRIAYLQIEGDEELILAVEEALINYYKPPMNGSPVDVSFGSSKRFFVTLPDAIGKALDRWAEVENSKPATMAAFLLEKDIREAMAAGLVPPEPRPESNYKTLPDLIKDNMADLIASAKFPNGRLRELMEGARPDEVEVLRVALICGLTEEYVAELAGN